MTAFTSSDIPATINTLEKLHVWSGMILNYLYPETTVIESTGNAARVATSAPFEITAVSPPEWQNISRTNIKLNKNWQRQGKRWEHANDIGSASIPAEFKI
ncbi:hypothetical protein [Gloeothece verrucosa]|uniref:Glucose-6-phosphatedehydrogenase-6-phosphogluconolactonase n=1 Tax=Gloeothece verrucosa (strain PCC 7822) TaxID=497965 RepID=E0UAF1_GLOV7|nr:hypothetical protein [Gloeothece verrucosa]ADN12692.1 glucose-6-phosphatedehydrogenase-6- phosphogluconolactonase [Gloeothece verrucosa PCC 7822]